MRSPATATLAALVILAIVKGIVGWVVLHTGFVALSDDDFARVVISQRFAHAPAWDPSGTSWLPLPFWLYGSVMMVFGRELEVARTAAFALGIVSALCVFWAGRGLGFSRLQALLAAVLSGLLPNSARLSVATVPEALSAGLIVLGVSLGNKSVGRLCLGALCLALSCLCRYEAWPVAAVFALVCTYQALRLRSPWPFVAALVAIGPACGWMLHGALHHDGDWLFFVTRVGAYRAALSGAQAPVTVGAMLTPLWSLFRFEPELMGVLTLGLMTAVFSGQVGRLRDFERFLALLASILAFLVVGELFRATPTHHPGRVLLPLWFGAALLVVKVALLVVDTGQRGRWLTACAAGLWLVLSLGVLRSKLASDEAFAARSNEVQIGKAAARQQVMTVAIDTPDYGFFAVMAGLARPESSIVLNNHDPRTAPSGGVAQFADRLKTSRAGLLVCTEAQWKQHVGLGKVIGRAGDFVLVRLSRG